MFRREKPGMGEQFPNLQWVQGDILDMHSLEEACRGVRTIYHAAGKISFWSRDRAMLMKVNVEGTANVVNLALEQGVHKVVHISSVAAIGRPVNGQLIGEYCKWEDSPNNSQYALSKYLGEMEVWRAIGEGLDAVIVNPSIVLGRGNGKDGSSSLVRSAYREFPWYTKGINGFVDVNDVVQAMILLGQSPITARRFILSGDNWSYRRLFTEMAVALNRRPPHIKASPMLGSLVWKIMAFKSLFTGKAPLITRETARTAQLKVYYDTENIISALPGFRFTNLELSVKAACAAFLEQLGH